MMKVGFKNAEISCIIGCLEEEREKKQTLFVDCEYEVCCLQDDLGGTVDYRTVYEVLQKVAARNYFLLEALAEAMSEELLQTFTNLFSVTLCVKKPRALTNCEYSYVTVHAHRE